MDTQVSGSAQKAEHERRGQDSNKKKAAGVRKQALPPVVVEPQVSAQAAGLRYVSDTGPGLTRRRSGKSFCYLDAAGKLVRDAKVLRRIRSLAIPPAWTHVWICPREDGHIQAVGRDERGRKQYRYHPHWRQVRDETKYNRMLVFGQALRDVRKRVEQDLALPGLPKEKVLATVVRLLETTLIRVGNEEYAKKNHSFGLTTMQDRHVKIDHGVVHFRFRGKSGKFHTIDLEDKRLARIVQRCQHIPGHELFQYLDENGEHQPIDSADVNEYLQKISGQSFTAKDFRTWAGTVLAALALQAFEAFDSHAQAKKNVVQAIESVAARLGNTPAICRKCYVHPAVLDAYLDGSLISTLQQRTEAELQDNLHGLPPEEAAVMAFLEQRLALAAEHQTKDKAANGHGARGHGK